MNLLKRKGLALLLMLTLIIGVVGCQPVNEEKNDKEVEETENTENNQEDSDEEEIKETETPEETVDNNEETSSEEEEAVEVEEPEYPDMEQVQLFDELLEQVAFESLSSSPLNATFSIRDLEAYGLEHLEKELDSISVEDSEDTLAMLEEYLEIFNSIEREALLPEQQLDYDLFKFDLESSIATSSYLYMSSTLDTMNGVHVNIPLYMTQTTFEDQEDVENFILRVSEIDRLFDECIVYEQLRLEEGYAVRSDNYTQVIETIENIVYDENGDMNDGKGYMIYISLEQGMEGIEALTAEQKEAYLAEMEVIIEEEIFPALLRMQDQARVMEAESTNDGSIARVPGGKEYYSLFINEQTFGELSVEGLRNWATNQIGVVYDMYMELITEYPEYETMDIYEALPDYEAFADLYTLTDTMYAENFYDYAFDPATEFIIPEYLEDDFPPGFYFSVTVDGGKYGNMYLSQEAYDEPDAFTFVTYAHENVPGHHLYFSYVANSDESLYRKLTGYNSYVEGWAKHVENLAFDYMDMDEVSKQLILINSYFSEALMVLIDIQYHYDGATYEEILQTLTDYGFGEPESTLERIALNPGEVIHYYYGAYRLREIQDEFEDHYGDAFDIKDYHDFVLSHYGLPFETLEAEMEKMFAAEAGE